MKYIIIDVTYPASEIEADFAREPQRGEFIYNTELDSLWNVVLGKAVYEDKIIIYVGESDPPIDGIMKAMGYKNG